MPLRHRILLVFTILYIVGFGAYYVRASNFEFIGYLGVLVAAFALIYVTLPRTKFTLPILWGLSVWGLLHLAGGSVQVAGDALYAWHVLPIYDGGGEFFVLRMDQLVHAFGFGAAALAVMHLLSQFAFRPSASRFWLGVTAVCVSMGLGAVNEIIEFIAVVVVRDTGVGGYYNTALDLVFNAVGATIAVASVLLWRRWSGGRTALIG